MLSALIISPFNFFSQKDANFDFPDAVGPANKNNFFVQINLVLRQDIFFDYFYLL